MNALRIPTYDDSYTTKILDCTSEQLEEPTSLRLYHYNVQAFVQNAETHLQELRDFLVRRHDFIANARRGQCEFAQCHSRPVPNLDASTSTTSSAWNGTRIVFRRKVLALEAELEAVEQHVRTTLRESDMSDAAREELVLQWIAIGNVKSDMATWQDDLVEVRDNLVAIDALGRHWLQTVVI